MRKTKLIYSRRSAACLRLVNCKRKYLSQFINDDRRELAGALCVGLIQLK